MKSKILEDKNNTETKLSVLNLKEYSEPKITKLGAMQKVTQGGSSGFGDSAGDHNNEQP